MSARVWGVTWRLGPPPVRKGGTGKRGGSRSGAGRPPVKGLAELPPGVAAACVREAERGGAGESVCELRAQLKVASAQCGELQAKLDCLTKTTGDAIRFRRHVEGKLAAAHVQITELENAAAAASVPPPPSPPAPPPPAPPPPEPPPLREYKSDSSKHRAVAKHRRFLRQYPAECHADLIARTIIVDGRGKQVGISVSLVKELLSTPRMARPMKEYAESILRGAREHMMKAVFSAENFTSARRLLRLSYRKLEWLRRLLSHDGKSKRAMHPDYGTTAPMLPSIPAMKLDEAEVLRDYGGVIQQDDGRGAFCEDLERTLCQTISHTHSQGELTTTGTKTDPHIAMWAGDGFMARKKGKWVQLGVILCSTVAGITIESPPAPRRTRDSKLIQTMSQFRTPPLSS